MKAGELDLGVDHQAILEKVVRKAKLYFPLVITSVDFPCR